jgi:hypothetical protein
VVAAGWATRFNRPADPGDPDTSASMFAAHAAGGALRYHREHPVGEAAGEAAAPEGRASPSRPARPFCPPARGNPVTGRDRRTTREENRRAA